MAQSIKCQKSCHCIMAGILTFILRCEKAGPARGCFAPAGATTFCRQAKTALHPPFLFVLPKRKAPWTVEKKRALFLTNRESPGHSTRFSAAFAVTSLLPASGPALSAPLSATWAVGGSRLFAAPWTARGKEKQLLLVLAAYRFTGRQAYSGKRKGS